MVSYNTSFIINLADLAKILDQIRIAERHAAGESLVDIIGQDNALLPLGLRTVDGSYNHLLPGQELVGAADQLFPRLLDPVYRNDADGDTMPLGPPGSGAPTITNTNYASFGSVADADPRIISNLIVDQTLGNRSALVAALIVAGSANPNADADAILAARAAAEAAAADTLTHDAYLAAETSATGVQSFIAAVLLELAAFRTGVDDNLLDASDTQHAANAALAAQQAKLAQDAVVLALQQPGASVAAADLAAAVSLQTALTNLNGALAGYADTVTGPLGDGLNFSEFNALVSAEATATTLSASASANLSALSAAEQNTSGAGAAQVLVDLVNAAGLNITADGSIIIEHRSADIGLSPANSGWMTLFGQFFDHGLDLVTKGGNGTVYVPLQADDPLYDLGANGVANDGLGTDTIDGNEIGDLLDDDGAGADGVFGTIDDSPNFMALTRATPFVDPVTGRVEGQNTTTPFVDQNQTYTSSPSHQVFLREYKLDPAGSVVNTGRLLDGANGGIANWAETKAQAAEMLGLLLNDFDVHDVPKIVVDPYGKFIPGDNGFAQVYVKIAIVNTLTGAVTAQPGEYIVEGVANGLDLHTLSLPPGFTPGLLGPNETYVTSTVGTGHAFLNDIAHHAAPGVIDHDHNPATPKITQTADTDVLDFNGDGAVDNADLVAGAGIIQDANGDAAIDLLDLADVNLDGVIDAKDLTADDRNPLTYDNEMLGAHFITGDGRGNENIGLTAVHFIFHAEHNRLVEANKDTLIASGDAVVVNEWLAAGLGGVRNAITQPELDAINAIVDPAEKATTIDALNWDGERLFQAARFVTEMQYQHLVFEEFARRIQPNVDPFVFTNSADLDPSILAEFAHTVYRFGHSMLTDTVDRLDQDLTTINSNGLTDDANQIGLIAAFLNPQAFTASSGAALDDATSAGAIIRGMSRQVGNEMDEFIVEALRNNLVGLPLDLAVLNIARGRDTGIPSLNQTREQLYAMTGHVDVKPYTSWIDLTQHMKHPLSVINFIAAYGTHEAITTATTIEQRREAATLLVLGDGNDGDGVTIRGVTYSNDERLAFLNGSDSYSGSAAQGAAGSLGGLNFVDLWIGGLAEEIKEFGGQLGSTFNFIFEYQMEHLQNGDRFYYLSRTQGMNLLNLLEPNTFADIIMRNTDLGDLHATHLSAEIMEVPDMILELDPLVMQENYSGDLLLDGTNPADRSLLDPEHEDPVLQSLDPKVFRQLATTDIDGNGFVDGNILKFSGGEHVVLGGTEGNDSLYGDKGIDTLWGDGGNDYLNPGMESDQVFGGEGDDIIEDPFGDDFLRGEAGDDVVVNGSGLDILFGGEGQDFIMAVTDTTEVFAGPGNDFILGGTAPDILMGNEGDDWIEGGEGFDGLSGENSELFFNSPIVGHDILNGQGNDTDYDGENGDDIMVQSAGIQRSNGMDGFDWAIHKGDPNGADSDLGIRPFDTREALILRDRFDSVEGLSGWNNDDILTGALRPLLGENFADALTQDGVNRIDGMREFLGIGPQNAAPGTDVVFESDVNIGGEIIMGGDGSDVIRGNLGNDILDGDAWLNVRISVRESKDPTSVELFTVDSLTSIVAGTGDPALDGKQLADLMRTGIINPGQLQAVREVLYDDTNVDNADPLHDRDIAVFSDVQSNYILEGEDVGAGIAAMDLDGDGFIMVEHILAGGGGGGGAGPDDGIDKIRNFEILSFVDGNVFLDPTVANTPATGLLAIIDGGPAGITVGEPLTASIVDNPATLVAEGIIDPDGVPPISAFTFTWQFEQTPGVGDWADIADPLTGDPVTGVTFVPTAAHELDGLALRVVGRFIDNQGIPEVVFSDPTDPVAPAVASGPTEGDDIIVGTLNDDNGVAATPGGPVFPILQGLGGNDTISGLAGNDILVGGRLPVGLIPGDNAGSDILDGGLGNDIAVFFGNPTDFTFALAPDGTFEVVDNLTLEEDAVINIETIEFRDAATDAVLQTFNVADILDGSVLIGTDADEVFDQVAPFDFLTTDFGDEIDARGGADTIAAGAGKDVIGGGDGDDIIDTGGGDDEVSGGNGTNDIRLRLGNETLLVGLSETGTDTVRNDGGTERISIGQVVTSTLNPTPAVTVATEAGVVSSLSAADDGAGNLAMTVNAKAVTILDQFNSPANAVELISFNSSAFSGETLPAGDYNLIAAAAGTATLVGTVNADALFGTGGPNLLEGGLGNDVYFVDATDIGISEGNDPASGTDTVISTATYALSANTENLVLIGGAAINGTGNSGVNRIVGNDEGNTLAGLDGDDTLVGNGGIDILQGGADNDTYVIGLGDGNDTVNELSGTGDRIEIVTGGAALTAFNAQDNSTGTNNGNLVFTVNTQTISVTDHFDQANENVDFINFDGATYQGYTLGSTDYAVNSQDAGNNTRTAAIGVNTLLAGETVANVLTGNTGNDLLFGFGGNDTLSGGTGNDLLVGGAGTDGITGGGGDDTIVHTIGDGGGSVNGGLNTDRLVILAGAGAQTLAVAFNGTSITNFDGGTVTNVEQVMADLGDGIDALTYTAAGGATVNLGLGTASGFASIAGIENVNGNGGVDNITGDDNANIINGNGGSDVLSGGGGADTLSGGAGNNDLIGDSGDDILIASAGAAANRSDMDGGDGIDTADYSAFAAALSVVLNGATQTTVGGSGGTLDTIVNVENFEGGGGGDGITGDANANNLIGNGGGDTLTGGGGDDLLEGGVGIDRAVLSGALADYSFAFNAGGGVVVTDNRGGSPDGVDTLIGIEQMQFGAAITSLQVGTAGADNFNATTAPELFFGLGGTDTVTYAGGAAVVASLATGSAANGDMYFSIESLTGGSGGDTLTGDGFSNVLSGGAGGDTLNGGAGGDIFIGGSGADNIDTGAADDNVSDIVRYTAAADYTAGSADSVTNFDATGTAAEVDRVEFGGGLNGAFDDGLANDTFLFASGNGVAGAVTVTVGQGNADSEALYLSGANGEGVIGINLANAAQVAAAFNGEFNITAANGEDAVLVINATDGNNFAVWQWIQAGGGEISAGELALIGTFQSNGTVATDSFDFV